MLSMNPGVFSTSTRRSRLALLWLLLISVSFLPNFTFALSKKELEKRKQQIHKDIEYTNKLLSQTRKSKTASLSQLITLNKQISYRSELIGTIHSEISSVDGQINYTNVQIDSILGRMDELKKHYADLLYFAYKNQGAFSKLSFIFSSSDFNQAYQRLKYLQELSAYRIHQRNLIRQLANSLAEKKGVLTGVKKDKTELLTVQQKEKTNLSREKKDQIVMVNTLSSKEKKLKTDLRDKQKLEARLNRLIENAIRKEIELAQAVARKRSTSTLSADANTKKNKVESAPYVLSATPETMRLSNAFENNRGRLPWPVEQGFISSSYGRHSHPVWKDVVVNNSGVDINSSKGAKVRCLFEGKVTKIIVIMNKYAVIVQHGEYFTVYSNLQDVDVKSGDIISTKEVIGTVQTDDEGKSEVHLEIWKGSNKMDPEGWITARR
ncbi:peptidoglycan DD-metalloendopeptidase family protein [soil metagenome]